MSDASYTQHRAAQIRKLEMQIKQLEEEIKRLKEQKGISSALEGLAFDPRAGLYCEGFGGIYYCRKCLAKDKKHPLTTEESGWRCQVCDVFYSNPDRGPSVSEVGIV